MAEGENLFPVAISEKQFMREYERAKACVDLGIEDYFILIDDVSVSGVKEIGNTTLKDIADVFGAGYIPFFRFAQVFDVDESAIKSEAEKAMSISIRPLTKADRRRMGAVLKFFPPDCWVCDWKDGTHFTLSFPFIQDKSGNVKFLYESPVYRKEWRKDFGKGYKTVPNEFLKHVIERLPDFFECCFAIVRYKHVDMMIPLPQGTGKSTFKKRDKDATGVKRHLIHEVSAHGRKSLKNTPMVAKHLRGTSDFTINGVDVTLSSSIEWTMEYIARRKEENKTD